MATHDIVARVGAVFSIFAALWNMVASSLFILSLIWFLVGALWFIPLALAVVQIIAAVGILVVGQHKATPLVPLLGLLVSACNLNILAGLLEVCALMAQGVAWYVQSQEANQDVQAAYAA
jgi:hypothetical protein